MTTVVLVIHLMIAAALVAVVLLQRSEGGALGIGGGGGGGFLTGRGTANLLTRATAGLAAAFFATSIILSILANRATAPSSVFDRAAPAAPAQPGGSATPGSAPAPAAPAEGRGGILDKLQPKAPSGPAVPQTR
jgi:preprotein translocase subunit SecG